MAQTYKPGETVPKDGTVECTQYNGTRESRQSRQDVPTV